MLKIDIRSLSNGVHDLSFTPSPEEIEVSEDKFTDLKLDVRLDIASRRLYVRVKIAATAALVCDRTSVDYTLPVKGFFSVVFVPPEGLDGDEERDDLFPLLQGAEDIDLTTIVRDTLLLAVPIRKIAPGADEEDIPTSFGEPTEADLDPRWVALKALKSDSGTESR